jgi:hypothetical protein
MSPQMRTCTARRADLIQVHDHCPEESYVELEVPADAQEIVEVTFTAISRDQGD